MDRNRALQVVGLDDHATQEQVAQAVQVQTDQLVSRMKSAPTAALRQKYEAALQEIANAAKHLGVVTNLDFSAPGAGDDNNHNTPLSSTKLYDLPAAAPVASTSLQSLVDDPQAGLKAGQVLAGRYTIRALVGMGGMGAVYAAFDQNLGEDIAVKVLTPSLLRNEQARERFLNEAKTYARLSHENIINVHDVQRDNDLYFITMELLKGCSLRQELVNRQRSKTQFTLDEVRKIARLVGTALDYAHAMTVHRDVKPENIWVGDDGNIKLMDFGIARMLSTGRMTQTAMVMGTAGYMAPEQLSGLADIDGRADQYALAVVIYEMLTGVVPGVRMKPLVDVRPDVGTGVSAAVDRALEQSPSDRFATLKEFTTALDNARPAGRSKKPLVYVAAALALGGAGYFAVATEPGQAAVTYATDYIQSPAIVTAKPAVEATADSITLEFKDLPATARQFLVYRSDKPNDGFIEHGRLDSGENTYIDNIDVSPDTAYHYKLIAQNSAGKLSDLALTSVIKAESKPDPASVNAPADIQTARLSTNEIELTWKAKNPVGTTVDVSRSKSEAGPFTKINTEVVHSEEGRYKDSTGLEPGQTYYYKLQANYKSVLSRESPVVPQRTKSNPPAAPVAVAADPTEQGLRVKWDDIFEEGTSIIISRSTSENGKYEEQARVPSTQEAFDDDRLEPDSPYYYKLVASYDDEVSPPASIPGKTKPAPPNAVSVLKSELVNGDQVRLSWSNVNSDATEFEIRKLEGGNYTPVDRVPADKPEYTFTHQRELDQNFQVVALNGDVAGPPSLISIPAAPTNLDFEETPEGIKLKWQNPSKLPIKQYTLYKKDADSQAGITELSAIDKKIIPGAEYTYHVRAHTDSGYADSRPFAVKLKPDAPVIAPAQVTENSGSFTWQRPKAAPYITNYRVEQFESANPVAVKTDTIGPDQLAYLADNLKSGTEYRFKVSALTASGQENATEYALKTPEKPKLTPTPTPTKTPIRQVAAPKKPDPPKKTAKKEEEPRDTTKFYDSKPGKYAVNEYVNGKSMWRYATPSEIRQIDAAPNKRIVGEAKLVPTPQPTPAPTPPPMYAPPPPPQQQRQPPPQQQQQIDPATAILGILAVGAAVDALSD